MNCSCYFVFLCNFEVIAQKFSDKTNFATDFESFKLLIFQIANLLSLRPQQNGSNTQQSLLLGASISAFLVIVTMFLVNKILKKNKGDNVLLKDPETKYEVKLIEKEVRRGFRDRS